MDLSNADGMRGENKTCKKCSSRGTSCMKDRMIAEVRVPSRERSEVELRPWHTHQEVAWVYAQPGAPAGEVPPAVERHLHLLTRHAPAPLPSQQVDPPAVADAALAPVEPAGPGPLDEAEEAGAQPLQKVDQVRFCRYRFCATVFAS